MALDLETLAVGLVVDTDEFDSGLKDADNIAQGWAGKLGGAVSGLLKGALLGGTAALVAGVISVGAAAFDVSTQVDTATADIAASLRVPTAEAERFADVARRVYGNNFADSVTDAAEGVKQLALQMGLAADDPSLQNLTENAFRLRDSFGIEVPESVNAAKTLMEQFGLTGQQAFDFIAAGQQRGLDTSGDLLDTIGEYSNQFSNVGFSAEEFFSILEAGQQGGVLGTDKIADSIKEMSIILNEGTDDAKDAFSAIGLNFDQIAASVAAGDEAWADYFPNIIAGLQDIEDPIAKSQAQVAIFGTMAEDLGTDFTDAFQVSRKEVDLFGKTITSVSMDATTSMADMEGAASSLDAKYATLGSAIEGMWRRLTVSVSPFTDKLLDLVNDAMPKVMEGFDRFDAAIGPTMNGIGNVINSVVTTVNGLFSRFRESVDTDAVGPLKYWQEWADANLPRLQQLFETILSGIQTFWDQHGANIMHIVNNTFGTIWTVIDTVMRTIGDLITLALQLLTGDWEGAFNTVIGITERLWETIKTIVGNQLDSIRTAITAIDWGATGNAIIQGIADGITNGAQYIVNAAEDAANRALQAAKSWLGIRSPSRKAADEVGEPWAEGVGVGAMRGLRNLAGQIDSGLASVMGDISMPQPALAGVGGRAPITIHITLQGGATYEDGRAVGAGVSDELRSRGLA